MSKELKEAEISELQVQNRKRNIATATSFVVGGIVGYAVFKQMKPKKGGMFKFVLGGSLLFGLAYWGLTLKRTTRRKGAIQEKRAMIEKGTTKPASAPAPTDQAPTTVVELTPTGTPKPSSGMIYKN
jgi:hypothetical protein